MTSLSGDPDQTFGGVRVGDVARAIRNRPTRFQYVADIHARWLMLTGQLEGPRLNQVTRIVTGLTHQRRTRQAGESGWVIDQAQLEKAWPRLPWAD